MYSNANDDGNKQIMIQQVNPSTLIVNMEEYSSGITPTLFQELRGVSSNAGRQLANFNLIFDIRSAETNKMVLSYEDCHTILKEFQFQEDLPKSIGIVTSGSSMTYEITRELLRHAGEQTLPYMRFHDLSHAIDWVEQFETK